VLGVLENVVCVVDAFVVVVVEVVGVGIVVDVVVDAVVAWPTSILDIAFKSSASVGTAVVVEVSPVVSVETRFWSMLTLVVSTVVVDVVVVVGLVVVVVVIALVTVGGAADVVVVMTVVDSGSAERSVEDTVIVGMVVSVVCSG
jgi:hypothetical protein